MKEMTAAQPSRKRSSYNIPLQRELFQFVRGLTQLEGEDGDLVEGEVELA